MKLAIVFGLAFCASAFGDSGWRRITLPTGGIGYSVRCENEGLNVCYEMAGDVCHRGYTVQNQNQQAGFESTGGGYVGPGFTPGTTIGVSSASAKSTSDNGLIIQCTDPEVTEYERAEKYKKERAQQDLEAKKGLRGLLITATALAAILVTVVVVSKQ